MLILGLNTFHADSSAALVDADTGRLIAAVAEERLNRIKHFAGFPERAIRECLKIAGAEPHDVAHVAIARDASANLTAKLGFALKNLPRMPQLARQRLQRRAEVESAPQLLERALGFAKGKLPAQVHHLEHHLAHLASSFLVSPFDRAALLSIDGFGDFASTMTGVGEGTSIKVFDRTLFPQSMGIVYSAVCQFIGYTQYGDEGKVMGLAPYGQDTYRDFFDELVQLKDGGRFRLNLDYFVHHTEGVDYTFDAEGRPTVAPLYSQELVKKFGPARLPRAELTQREMDLARSLQASLERVYFHVLRDLHARTGCDRLCLAGGVALNSVANGMIFDQTPFREVYIQPAAGDDGTAIGAAYWVLNQVLNRPRSFQMRHASTGPEFDDAQIADVLGAARIPAERLSEDALLDRTARAIADAKVVGWFQGRMEWGPRALGNRSIVAHPGHPQMKDILNARIKHREWFRPFAPSILAERLGDYFECSHPSPFMLMVYKTRPSAYQALCAVDHVDHTGRVQTVDRDENPKYYRLIEAFERLTGIPAVLNTSFNENEPIVCTPAEAIDCFQRTHMDALAIGSFFCHKQGAT
ncbi:MAG: carbamoyltransferase [Planctomycetes bacterium]|nr:carbamoyltransferase [Planctomycetota bacterium]